MNFPICSYNGHILQFHSRVFGIIMAIIETFWNHKLNFEFY